MNKKKRIAIISAAILLMALGFVCIAVAANAQNKLNPAIVNGIGITSFVFLGLAIYLLLKNYEGLASSEMNEMAEKMHKETEYFTAITMNETPQTLQERFIALGFEPQQACLHKRQFSFAKDYINYYVVIADEVNIIAYLESFIDEFESLVQDQSRLSKNKVVYLFFFKQNITDEELDFLKTVIINQDVAQSLPLDYDTVLPIVYDTSRGEYIVKASKSKFSIKPLQIALRNFYKIVRKTGELS